MLFANRMIIDNNTSKHRIEQIPARIPDRLSMFYDKTLCEEFEEQFPFNFPNEIEQLNTCVKQLMKKK